MTLANRIIAHKFDLRIEKLLGGLLRAPTNFAEGRLVFWLFRSPHRFDIFAWIVGQVLQVASVSIHYIDFPVVVSIRLEGNSGTIR